MGFAIKELLIFHIPPLEKKPAPSGIGRNQTGYSSSFALKQAMFFLF
jgi:hypothetical protein